MKIDNWIIVSFVTHNTPYEKVLAQYLLPSLDKLKLPHHIEVIENQGSWLKNVAQKPKVILNALEKYPHLNIVCLDADSEILSYPELFNQIPDEYDIALHKLNWRTFYGHDVDRQEILSGSLWLRNNDKIKDLVTQWYLEATKSFEWEQKVLEKLLLKNIDIKVFELPLSYCFITTLPDGSKPKVECNPVIQHNQVSRYLKRQIR